MTAAIMVQGTGSDVGKSLIVAGLCRAFLKRGLVVRPFKPQNMSNNAAVTVDGGEIGRAQALQAIASKVDPTVHMNPVLLKPETNIGSQVIVQGKRVATMTARQYFKERQQFMPAILESFEYLRAEADIVFVEGAGSPAEVNLRERDLANMGFADAANLPVILVADIHRGGVIASVVGTKAVLEDDDANRVKAFLINNFHGDVSLFDEGVSIIEKHSGWTSAGVIPHFQDARMLPAEDSLSLSNIGGGQGSIKIAVLRLARIANFDDLDPLRLEKDVSVEFVEAGEAIPGGADLVIIPGSKSTISDLQHFREQGWDIDLQAHVRRGGKVLGLCGGYQMLGRMLHDPQGIEGPVQSVEGLGLLDVETILTERKELSYQSGRHVATSAPLQGYEMHLGETKGPGRDRPFSLIHDGELERAEGAISESGQIAGTYLHGIFTGDSFRYAFLEHEFQHHGVKVSYNSLIEDVLDRLALHLEENVDLELILDIAQRGR